MMISTDAIIVFGRYPRLGIGKTRLAANLGPERALAFYRSCLNHILDEAFKLNNDAKIYFFYADPHDEESVKGWLGDRFLCRPQSDEDLVGRNRNAFERVFAEGAKRVLIVATDVPSLSGERFREAFRALDKSEIVIGPDNDGGYYLLGMRQLYPEIFRLTYGGKQGLFSQLLDCFQKERLTFSLLPKCFDIDTVEDLRSWSAAADSLDHPLKRICDSWLNNS